MNDYMLDDGDFYEATVSITRYQELEEDNQIQEAKIEDLEITVEELKEYIRRIDRVLKGENNDKEIETNKILNEVKERGYM